MNLLIRSLARLVTVGLCGYAVSLQLSRDDFSLLTLASLISLIAIISITSWLVVCDLWLGKDL